MEPAPTGLNTRIAAAELRSGLIAAEGSLDEQRSAIDDGQLLIFRGVFASTEMIAVRRSVQQWSATVAPFPVGQSASRPGLNFHRLDDGSAVTTTPHIFQQFGFGNVIGLPGDLSASLIRISSALLHFQNELAGTQFAFLGGGFRTKVMRHPRGGGFLARHRHPYLPQRVSLFLNLSQPGVDYLSGGASFAAREGWANTYRQFQIGDILAWRYDMVHAIEPVDPGRQPKWEDDDGFWIYALEMDEVHKASRAEDGAQSPQNPTWDRQSQSG